MRAVYLIEQAVDEMAKDAAASSHWGDKISAAPKACWQNSVKLLRRISKTDGDYRYVEGFAMLNSGGAKGFVIEHGWVIDSQGNEIDPTLPHDDLLYFPGVTYTKSQVMGLKDPPFVWQTGGYGGFRNKEYKAAHDAAWSYVLKPKAVEEMAKDKAKSARWRNKIKTVPKACWDNAVALLKKISNTKTGYRYAEGFVTEYNRRSRKLTYDEVQDGIRHTDKGFVIEHGWVIDPQGNEIDPTLPHDDLVYFPGVTYTIDQVEELRDPPFVWQTGGFGGLKNKKYRAAFEAAWTYAIKPKAAVGPPS